MYNTSIYYMYDVHLVVVLCPSYSRLSLYNNNNNNIKYPTSHVYDVNVYNARLRYTAGHRRIILRYIMTWHAGGCVLLFDLELTRSFFVILLLLHRHVCIVPGHKSGGDASGIQSEPVTWPRCRQLAAVTYANSPDNL